MLTKLSLCLPLTLGAQGTFQNMGFESPSFVSAGTYPPEAMQWGPAMPNWTGYYGNTACSTILYNNETLGGPGISIFNASYSRQPLFGNYSVMLIGGWNWAANAPYDASIAQTAVVPSSALSLRFAANSFGGPVSVSLGGTPLSVMVLGTYANYTTYGASTVGLGGQNLELRITCPGSPSDNHLLLDNVTFSTSAVPEPAGWWVMGLGGGVIFWFGRRGRGFC